VIERVSEGFRARCDQCSVTSAIFPSANENGARLDLRAAGWSFTDRDGGLTYCPKCGTTPASPSSKRKMTSGKESA
jgi:hypothetical protein